MAVNKDGIEEHEELANLCIKLMGIEGPEAELFKQLCELEERGDKVSLTELIELEDKMGIQVTYQPLWIIEEEGNVHIASVIIDFLQQRFPQLPVGATLRLCNIREGFGIKQELERSVAFIKGLSPEEGAVIYVKGAEGSGREFFLEQLAAHSDMNLIEIEAEGFLYSNGNDNRSLARAINSLSIAAALYGALVYVKCSGQLIKNSEFPVSYDNAGLRNPLELIRQLSETFGVLGLVIGGIEIEKNRTDVSAEYTDFGQKTIVFRIPENTGEQRRNIADSILRSSGVEEENIYKLVHSISGVNIPTAAYVRYVNSIVAAYMSGDTVDNILENLSSAMGNENLKYLKAERKLEELKLPAKQKAELNKICKLCFARDKVLNEGGFNNKFSYGNGLSVLFYGAPGTGKTMAAQVIAGYMGKPLYRVELSQLINKYVGETQKNIGRIFDEAAKNDCVLLFDEADAIFAKRGEVADAQDRYSNAETAYLLQRMESYTGICVLTTNLLQNFDEAFRRRITYMINFPMPDATLRLELWNEIFPEATKVGASVDRKLLADTFELSGAAIRNIAQHAALLATAEEYEEVQMHHILDGIMNEYSKTGKNLSNTQKEIINSWA